MQKSVRVTLNIVYKSKRVKLYPALFCKTIITVRIKIKSNFPIKHFNYKCWQGF